MQMTRRQLQALSFLFLCISICYGNTLTAEWHLDDFPNIVQNEKLHLTSLSLDSLNQTFFANPINSQKILRPLSYLSFSLNWYFGTNNVIGYHLVNILFHLGTAFLLYLTVIKLLETPLLQQRSENKKHLIALLSALFWALNPVQTQAVTYIVQRMAVLAAFFFMASLLCYLMGRSSKQRNRRVVWFLTAVGCFILSLGSKENSITLPATLLLVEGIFFFTLGKIQKKHIFISALLLCLTGAGVYLLTNGNPFGFLSGYEQRSFTCWQRLLTESRIVVFYLSLLFFPAPFRLSLNHDITLSTALLHPPTTLLSIGFLCILTIWALWKHKSLPFAAFAILFFLLNHVTESSIIPLELIFEHRNYLPSFFLFLPLIVPLVDVYETSRVRSMPIRRYTLAGIILLVLCALVSATYIRNNVWHTEQNLWQDSLAKAPGQSRPYINLALTYQNMGRDEEAFELCRKSLTKTSPTPAKDRMRAYNCMGNIAMDRGGFTKAISYYLDALHANENPFSHYFLHKALLANGQVDDALNELEPLIHVNPADNELKISMAIVLAKRQEFSKAITILRAAQKKTEKNSYEQGSAQICLGSILSRMGNFKKAEVQFREVLSYSEPRLPLLCVIGNYIRQGNTEAATAQLKEMLKFFKTEDLLNIVQSESRQNIFFPIERMKLADFIGSATSYTPDNLKP